MGPGSYHTLGQEAAYISTPLLVDLLIIGVILTAATDDLHVVVSAALHTHKAYYYV